MLNVLFCHVRPLRPNCAAVLLQGLEGVGTRRGRDVWVLVPLTPPLGPAGRSRGHPQRGWDSGSGRQAGLLRPRGEGAVPVTGPAECQDCSSARPSSSLAASHLRGARSPRASATGSASSREVRWLPLAPGGSGTHWLRHPAGSRRLGCGVSRLPRALEGNDPELMMPTPCSPLGLGAAEVSRGSFNRPSTGVSFIWCWKYWCSVPGTAEVKHHVITY